MKKFLLFLAILPVIFTYAADADSYQWLHAKAFNGMNATGMTVDSHNNTYFYGFSFTDLKYGEATTTVDYQNDQTSIFVIKLNAQHEYQWTKRIHVEKNAEAGSTSLNVRSMDVDPDGNMYFGGDLMGAVDVNSIAYGLFDNSSAYFVMKTNALGEIQWFTAGSESLGSVHKVKYTAGRLAFVSAWQPMSTEGSELFGTSLMTKFGSLQNFIDCDMMVGALSVENGSIAFAQGIKTGHNLTMQQLLSTTPLLNQNTLDADSSGNLYISGGFNTNQLKVAGTNYDIATGTQAAESQFVLRVDVFGGISWVKIITNATGIYPTLAVNNSSSRVAVLFNGGNNYMKIGDHAISVNGDASKMNHIALFTLNGELSKTQMINAKAKFIAPSINGSFCVAGNLTSNGQYIGMDGLYNGESTQENLFVGFFDRELSGLGGQSVISEGMYAPVSIKSGPDGKIRLLGSINFQATNPTITYPFGEYVVPRPEGDNKHIYSVLDTKQLIKAQLNVYPMECGRYSININPSVKSRVQWFVNDVAKGTDFELMGDDEMGGYYFETGVHYIKAVLTDSTDANNTAEFRDTVTTYKPVVNINTQINPQTGVVDYSVVVSNYAPEYNLSIDRENYDYAPEPADPNGTYTYTPGTHTIKVILSETSNWNCFFHFEKTFVVPEPKTSQECNNGAIKGHVESSIANFLAGEVRVDLFDITETGANILLKSDTIDSNGEFAFEGLAASDYMIRANIIDPTKYPELLVTYFNNIMNQVTSWQDATPITLACNQWADLNLTFAAINDYLSGTGSISGIISYSDGTPQGTKAMVKASTQVGDIVVANTPVILRRKSNGEIIARTTTDENGLYVFQNLPEDAYEIVVDIPGVPMGTSYDVTIGSGAPEVENRNFIVTQSGINITSQYAIVATHEGEGAVSSTGATMLNAGENKSYTITPGSGHNIDDVLVNGVSVGSLATYNFSNVNSNQTIHAIFRMTTSNSELSNSTLAVYPGVFVNEINISGLSKNRNIQVINQLGMVCASISNNDQTNIKLPLSALTAGMYLVRVVTETGNIKTFKVLKK